MAMRTWPWHPSAATRNFPNACPKKRNDSSSSAGRKHLEDVFGIKVRLYVPPWNKLAPTTAAVLDEEKLLLSGGGPEVSSSGKLNLGQIPCPTGIGETGRALATAKRIGGAGNCVGTILHDYDFKESNLDTSHFTLAEFEENLRGWKDAGQVEHKLISNAISPDRESEDKKAAANSNLRKVITSSRLRRKLYSNRLEVYWNTQTAERLAAQMRFVP